MPKIAHNVRKRKDGRWEWRCPIPKSTSGKSKYKSYYAKSYADIIVLMQNILPISTEKNAQTQEKIVYVSSIAEEWLQDISMNKKYSTYVKYKSIYEKYIKDIIMKVLAENSLAVSEYKNGKDKAFSFLVGMAMREAKGKADPKIINKILHMELDK